MSSANLTRSRRASKPLGGPSPATAVLSAEVRGGPPDAAPPHDEADAAVGLCDCPACLAERRRRLTHPLLARALAALYDSGDCLSIVRRNHGCDPGDCELCHDARLAGLLLGQLECSMEGEYLFVADAALSQRRADSERMRSRPRRRRRTWRPDHNGNYPPLPLAVMSLMDLRDALDALHRGHGCGDETCYVCELAEVGAYLAPMLTAAVETTMRFCPAVLRRRGIDPSREPLLRLLEHVDTLPAGAVGG